MPPDPEKEAAMKKSLAILEHLLEKTTYVAANHLTIADHSVLATLVFMEEVSLKTSVQQKNMSNKGDLLQTNAQNISKKF